MSERREGSQAENQPPKLEYSRESYQQILDLIEQYEVKSRLSQDDKAKYTQDLKEDKWIYAVTGSPTRKAKIERSNRGIARSQGKFQKLETEISKQQEKLKELYELAHAQALKADIEFEAQRLEKLNAEVEALDAKLNSPDPGHFLGSDEYERTVTQRDEALHEFLGDVSKYFHRLDEEEKK